jgi:hypothetical protein
MVPLLFARRVVAALFESDDYTLTARGSTQRHRPAVCLSSLVGVLPANDDPTFPGIGIQDKY